MSHERYLKKMLGLSHETHFQRMNDLLGRIKAHLADLENLANEIDDRWGEEDKVYRFYHHSIKVFYLQDMVKEAFRLIEAIGGEQDSPNEWYRQIVKEGTERGFNSSTNDEWLVQTRPILEAFWHTKYFVTMMIKYAKELESAPQMLPSGWAAVLYLFELR